MYGLSTADGFMTVNENLEEMIKYLANEPSLGLYFVQQHAQSTMPNLLTLKNRVVARTRETILHTEDLEDSIQAVRSMTDCGAPIIDEMINDINKSLHLMSISNPKRGLIQGSRFGRSSSHPVLASSDSMERGRTNGQGYLKSVFSSAKRRASALRWSPIDSTSQLLVPEGAGPLTHPESTPPALQLPGSSCDESHGRPTEQGNGPLTSRMDDHLSLSYEQFQSEQEAKLEEWLQEAGEGDAHSIPK